MQFDQISDFRQSLREMVRELGMLNRKTSGTDLSPLQSHILIELDRKQQGATDLAISLCVEKASISRAVASMIKAGLVDRLADSRDGRAASFYLTQAGDALLSTLEQNANAFIRQALLLSSDQEQQQLNRTIKDFGRALKSARRQREQGVNIRPIEARDDAEMAQIIRQSFCDNQIDHLEGVSLHDPALDCLSGSYNTDGAAYWVVEASGTILGGVGIAPLTVDGEKSYCEMQKLFLAPSAQGLGLGRRMIALCIEKGQQMGYDYCYLETLQELSAAVGLYESFGFEYVTQRLGDTGHGSCDILMLKELNG